MNTLIKKYKKPGIIAGMFIAGAFIWVLGAKTAFWTNVYISGVFRDKCSSETKLTREESKDLRYDFSKQPFRRTTTHWVYETDGFLQFKQPIKKEVVTYHYANK